MVWLLQSAILAPTRAAGLADADDKGESFWFRLSNSLGVVMRKKMTPSSGEKSWFSNLFGRFSLSDAGNVAIIFAVAMVPIVMAAGMAVDLARSLVVRQQLGQALDAVALSIGGRPGLTDEQREDLAEEFFKANYPDFDMGQITDFSIVANELTVEASGTAEVDTTIMGIFGFDSLSITQSVEVTRELGGLEVVMVLDNTGSMSGSKIQALRDSATTLVETLFDEDDGSGLLRIGLVPFAAAVNVGTDALANGWIDDEAQSSIAGENFTIGVNVLDLYDNIPNFAWNGCIETRAEPYDTSDDEPTDANPDTLWLPFFAPDERNGDDDYDNSYLKDKIGGSADTRQRYTGKYNGTNAKTSNNRGPHRGCTVAEIMPLTDNETALIDAIDDMGASGWTHIPIGLAWGQRVLSPQQPYDEGSEYDDNEWRKALIVLTDGENTVDMEPSGNHNISEYSAYGYLAEGRLGTTTESGFVTALDDKTSSLCEDLKDNDVEVYSLTFEIDDDDVQALMRNCASSVDNYFDSPSESELEAAFEAIAVALSNLRISR